MNGYFPQNDYRYYLMHSMSGGRKKTYVDGSGKVERTGEGLGDGKVGEGGRPSKWEWLPGGKNSSAYNRWYYQNHKEKWAKKTLNGAPAGVSGIREDVEEAYNTARNKASSAYDNIRERSNAAVRSAKSRAADLYDRSASAAGKVHDNVEEFATGKNAKKRLEGAAHRTERARVASDNAIKDANKYNNGQYFDKTGRENERIRINTTKSRRNLERAAREEVAAQKAYDRTLPGMRDSVVNTAKGIADKTRDYVRNKKKK